jgi:hypothetical protein
MRVPKGTIPHDDAEAEHEWQLRVHEANARIEAEQREWQAQMARVKALLAAAEESEWQALRAKKLESARIAEEREWQECMARARASDGAAHALPSPTPSHVTPAGSRAQPCAATFVDPFAALSSGSAASRDPSVRARATSTRTPPTATARRQRPVVVYWP